MLKCTSVKDRPKLYLIQCLPELVTYTQLRFHPKRKVIYVTNSIQSVVHDL